MSINTTKPSSSDEDSNRRRDLPTPPPTSPVQPSRPRYSQEELQAAEALLTLRYGRTVAQTLVPSKHNLEHEDAITSSPPPKPTSYGVSMIHDSLQEHPSSTPPLSEHMASSIFRRSSPVAEQERASRISTSSVTSDVRNAPSSQQFQISSPPPRDMARKQHNHSDPIARKANKSSEKGPGISGGNVFSALRKQGLIMDSDESTEGVQELRKEIEKESENNAWFRALHNGKR